MPLTTKQIADLNISMEAARLSNLGNVISNLVGASGSAFMSGSGLARPDKARFPVTTGLSTITNSTVTLSGSPTSTVQMWVSSESGSVAGDLIIRSWMPTAANNVVVIASTGSATDQFGWVKWEVQGT